MSVGKVSDSSFETDVIKASGPVVVDFWAKWSSQCRVIGPVLEEIADALGDKVRIVKLNLDENPATAIKYVRFTPCPPLFGIPLAATAQRVPVP